MFALFHHLLWLLPAVFILGLVIGSFLNVVIHRLPALIDYGWKHDCRDLLGEPPTEDTPPPGLALPRSHCPHCKQTIRARDNIPLFSYLLLGGRCRHCRQSISLRYPLIELLAAILAVVTVWQLGFSWQSLFALILGWSLLTLAVIDLDHMILPDHITQPLLWMGLLLSVWSVFCDPTSSILGAICGYGLLWSLYQGFKLFTGKEGMGYGDFKLLALLGAWMGWQALPLVILLSSLAGSLIGIAMIVFKRHERGQPLPFGPFLAVAGWVTLLWQEPLYDAYWRILGP